MSLCLLSFLKFWFEILFILVSFIFDSKYYVKNIVIDNNLKRIGTNITAKTIDYNIKKIYNNNLSKGTIKVVNEGKEGIVYIINDKEINLREPIDKVIEIGTGKLENYVGSITGYGADCIGCSGNVSCKTSNGTYNISNSGEYYNDSEYGSLRIVAADNSLFECGTVLDIKLTKGDTINAIVLDTGSALRNKWRNEGKIVIDVAFKTQNDPEVYKITDRSDSVEFNVKRWGW